MKLGIIVVYIVSEENERLLDLHLKQIEKNTTMPYTIYGSANRLFPEFKQKLQQSPNVKLFQLPATPLRSGCEHSHYLGQLVDIAVKDGVSHVVTLHMDSFPVQRGWEKILAEKLSETCVFATIEDISTACLFFTRDFYFKFKPKFMLSGKELACPKFKQYLYECHPTLHSGIGYGFKAYAEGLSWYYLRESNKRENKDRYGVISDDLIYHLGSAELLLAGQHQLPNILSSQNYIQFAGKILDGLSAIIPVRIKQALRMRLNAPVENFLGHTPLDLLLVQPRRKWRLEQMNRERQRLLDDPESYIKHLLKG